MSTDLQISANRLNSKKSTGPRSASGKLTSSQNACKTGIYSNAEIIRDESPADLDALAAEYHSYYNADGPTERALVDILVHSEWMLRRFRRAEAQLWNAIMDLDEKGNALPPDPEHDLGFAIDAGNGHSFARLQRRIDSTQRNYQRALKDLQHLQSSRPAAPLPDKIEPASETAPQPAPIGFVPSPPDSVPAISAQSAQPTASVPLVTPPIGFVPPSAPDPSVAPSSCYTEVVSPTQ